MAYYTEIEKIGDIRFDNFIAEFWVTPSVKKFLDSKKINLIELHRGELLGKEESQIIGLSEKEIGKKFSIIYYGIVSRRVHEGRNLINDKFKHNPKQIFLDSTFNINFHGDIFELKYKVLGEGK